MKWKICYKSTLTDRKNVIIENWKFFFHLFVFDRIWKSKFVKHNSFTVIFSKVFIIIYWSFLLSSIFFVEFHDLNFFACKIIPLSIRLIHPSYQMQRKKKRKGFTAVKLTFLYMIKWKTGYYSNELTKGKFSVFFCIMWKKRIYYCFYSENIGCMFVNGQNLYMYANDIFYH